MHCAQCATPIPDDSRFCLHCGSLVSDAEGQAHASSTMNASSQARMERVLKEDTKGEFEIERKLGQGGMAAVYLATEVRLGRKVAIKVLPPELTFGHGIERFVREAKTAAALDHPNIIPIYRITSGDTIFWYAMKFIEGKSLDEVVKEQKRFSLEDTVRYLGQAAEALEYAHRKSVVHRDVKPANMMLDEHGRLIVTDFGIAKARTEGTLTASGAAIGTPYFMSPEQAMGGTVSGASDQYSLGVVAYQMLCGQLPFEGESAVEILTKHSATEPPPLDVLRPGLPGHVYGAVARALAKKPGERFDSITQFVDVLRGAVPLPDSGPRRWSATIGVTPQGGEPAVAPGRKPAGGAKPAPATPARARRSPWVWVGVSVLVVGGGAAAVVMRQDRAAPLQEPTTAPVVQDSSSIAVAPPAATASDTGAASGSPAATDPGPSAPATTGTLAVRGLPAGGRVLVNGRAQSGRTIRLAPGRHAVRLEAAGFEPFEQSIEIRAGQNSSVSWVGRQADARVSAAAPDTNATQPPPPVTGNALLGDRGVLHVSVEPWANIEIDGVNRGRSRSREDTLSSGRHSISLSREGYVRVDTTITIRAGGSHRLNVRLRSP